MSNSSVCTICNDKCVSVTTDDCGYLGQVDYTQRNSTQVRQSSRSNNIQKYSVESCDCISVALKAFLPPTRATYVTVYV